MYPTRDEGIWSWRECCKKGYIGVGYEHATMCWNAMKSVYVRTIWRDGFTGGQWSEEVWASEGVEEMGSLEAVGDATVMDKGGFCGGGDRLVT